MVYEYKNLVVAINDVVDKFGFRLDVDFLPELTPNGR
jgi:hypothetical protein